MKSSSCQFCRLPAIQLVSPLDCPCRARLAAWVHVVANSENAAIIKVLNIRAVIGSGSLNPDQYRGRQCRPAGKTDNQGRFVTFTRLLCQRSDWGEPREKVRG